jgi:cell division septal protein FtsQ
MKFFSKGDAIRSPEFHKKKEREKRARLIALIFFLTVFIVTPIYLFRMNRFQVTNIELNGNNVTKYEDVAAIVAQELDGNYLYIFPKSNALIYPNNKIRDNILNNIPRIRDVKVSLVNPKSLNITIIEREPAGLYCRDANINSEGCYFMDDNGYIFSQAPSFSGDVYFVYATDPAIEDPLGKDYTSPEEFKKLPNLIDSLKEINIPLRSIVSTPNEYYLELVSKGKIIISKKDNLKEVASNLESFLNDQEITKKPDFFNNVAYIDMRFGNKIFYKLKNEI